MGGSVSDFDGDTLDYQWRSGITVITSGQEFPPFGGASVPLEPYTIPASELGLGIHTLTLVVSDDINPAVEAPITVTVQDSIAPTLAPVPDQTILWPPDHRLIPVTIAANAHDNSGGSVILDVQATSNEPADGLGDGDLAPDIIIEGIDQEMGDIFMKLRAERSGAGTGRIYTVTVTATDSSGNTSTSFVRIIVPHDQKKKSVFYSFPSTAWERGS